MIKKQETIGVAVGRFQVHTLHEGHRYLIDEIYRRHKEVVILIGAHNAQPTDRDPLSFEQRRALLKETYPAIVVDKIDDCPFDEEWSRELDKIIADKAQGREVTLYGSRDSFLPHYSGTYETYMIKEIKDVSGTKQRKDIGTTTMHSEPFRRGVIHAVTHMRDPLVYSAVHVALVHVTTQKVFLIRRAGETEWHFPGGIVSVMDESFESTAQREVGTYSDIREMDDPTYVGSCKLNDKRYQDTKDSILSAFFMVAHQSESLVASDDVSGARWFRISDVLRVLHDDHKELGQIFIEHFQEY